MVPASRSIDNFIIDTVTALAEPIVQELGLELVEVRYQRESHGWVLRFIVDRETGVTVDDCARVSREVGHLLEVEDPIDNPYTLEVSSPGLDRPLKNEKDFVRCKGLKAKVKTREPVAGQSRFVGIIENLDDGKLNLATEQGMVLIPLEQIAKAKLVIEF